MSESTPLEIVLWSVPDYLEHCTSYFELESITRNCMRCLPEFGQAPFGNFSGVVQDLEGNLSGTFRDRARNPKRNRSNMITSWTCREGDPRVLCYMPPKVGPQISY